MSYCRLIVFFEVISFKLNLCHNFFCVSEIIKHVFSLWSVIYLQLAASKSFLARLWEHLCSAEETKNETKRAGVFVSSYGGPCY